MERLFIATAFAAGVSFLATVSNAQAAPCILMTLTGTMSGPILLNGVGG
jgi:hypothetical protein